MLHVPLDLCCMRRKEMVYDHLTQLYFQTFGWCWCTVSLFIQALLHGGLASEVSVEVEMYTHDWYGLWIALTSLNLRWKGNGPICNVA